MLQSSILGEVFSRNSTSRTSELWHQVMVSEPLGDSAECENPKPPDFIKGRGCGAALQPAHLSKEIFGSQNVCNTDVQRLNLTDLEIEYWGGGFVFIIPQLQLLQQWDFSHGTLQ